MCMFVFWLCWKVVVDFSPISKMQSMICQWNSHNVDPKTGVTLGVAGFSARWFQAYICTSFANDEIIYPESIGLVKKLTGTTTFDHFSLPFFDFIFPNCGVHFHRTTVLIACYVHDFCHMVSAHTELALLVNNLMVIVTINTRDAVERIHGRRRFWSQWICTSSLAVWNGTEHCCSCGLDMMNVRVRKIIILLASQGNVGEVWIKDLYRGWRSGMRQKSNMVQFGIPDEWTRMTITFSHIRLEVLPCSSRAKCEYGKNDVAYDSTPCLS
jgi:hypothetical protein